MSLKQLIRVRFARPLGASAVGVAFAMCMACLDCAHANPAREIYSSKCASCHGAEGQGVVDGYEEPLAGDLTVGELASFIEGAMPEDDPEICVGDEARQVAAFIYETFYSPEARRRGGLASAPRVELARLTVPQYRNAVADLLARFTPVPKQQVPETASGEGGAPPGPQRGLRAEYFQSKGMSKADDLKQARVDTRVDFDFGNESPVEEIAAEQFAIIWEGSLLADDSGVYEFRVRTKNGARLYVNNDQTGSRRRLRDDSSVAGQSALIDAWVSSGEMREAAGRVYLLGGRRYPLRLEFFKYKEETASVKLEWKPPHGTWSVLDYHHVIAAESARVFAVETPFPADDRSLGYERGSSISHEWHTATTDAAIATAAEVVARLPLLAGVDENTPNRQARIGEFLGRFAETAYRRPLTGAEELLFRELVLAGAPGPETAVRRAVLLILTSPHFLYTDLTPAGRLPDQHAIAARLAFALWDSIPDETLLDAAGAGRLSTAEQIDEQARRMIGDPRARAKMRGFLHHWLEFDERDLAKDKEMFPEFDEAVIADLRESLELFFEEVVWSDASDFRQLLLADYLMLNERLRELYEPDGVDVLDEDDVAGGDDADVETTSASDFEQVHFSPQRRSGVLTHPYLLSAFAYHDSTSPIHRGVFLTRNIVGRSLRPPPMAVAFKSEEFAPELTMREKITQLTRDRACMSCHAIINPLGFALEHYDAVGRWRASENDKPVDANSQYTTADGEALEVDSARDIATIAIGSASARRAFVTQTFRHLVKQSPHAYGPDVVEKLCLEFANGGFNIQNLWVRIAAMAAAQGLDLTPPTESVP